MSDDTAPAAKAPPFTCSCGSTTLGKAFVRIELWLPTKAKPTSLRLEDGKGNPKPTSCCAICLPDAKSILLCYAKALARFKRYAWKMAYLMYADGTPSERVTRKELGL